MSCPLCEDRARPEDCEHLPEFTPPTPEETTQYEQDSIWHGWHRLKDYARSVHREGAEMAKGTVALRGFCSCGHPTIGVGCTTMCAAVAKIDRLLASEELQRKEIAALTSQLAEKDEVLRGFVKCYECQSPFYGHNHLGKTDCPSDMAAAILAKYQGDTPSSSTPTPEL